MRANGFADPPSNFNPRSLTTRSAAAPSQIRLAVAAVEGEMPDNFVLIWRRE
jgi:hypothetical protein